MKRVIIETPFAGDVKRNLRYLRACMRDCLLRGEAPFASHALYTQPGVLDDDTASDRDLGIRAGFEWRQAAELTVFYADLGWSRGMDLGLKHCKEVGLLEGEGFEIQRLASGWETETEYKTRWEV